MGSAEEGCRSRVLGETLCHRTGYRHTGVMRLHISRYYRNVTGMQGYYLMLSDLRFLEIV